MGILQGREWGEGRCQHNIWTMVEMGISGQWTPDQSWIDRWTRVGWMARFCHCTRVTEFYRVPKTFDDEVVAPTKSSSLEVVVVGVATQYNRRHHHHGTRRYYILGPIKSHSQPASKPGSQVAWGLRWQRWRRIMTRGALRLILFDCEMIIADSSRPDRWQRVPCRSLEDL